MIERQFVSQKIKEHEIQEYIATQLGKTGYSHTEIQRTPLGEKVIIFTTRPGMVVGKKGDNIKRLTDVLKKKFKMENPQIEIGEIKEPNLDAAYIADKIANTFERFGSKRFKSVGYKILQEILDAGALGAEVVISGKLPSSRAKKWRFKAGYLKKSGDISQSFVKKCYKVANLKSGTIGIQIRIMTSDIILPDKITFIEEKIAEQKQAEEKQIREEKGRKSYSRKKVDKELKEAKKEVKIDNVTEKKEEAIANEETA